MREPTGREAGTITTSAVSEQGTVDGAPRVSETAFTTTGPIPPPGVAHAASPTASQLAFGPGANHAGAATTPAVKHADDVARTEYIYETAQKAATGILGSLAPGYRAARDQQDVSAVAELGGAMIAAFSMVHGAKGALDQMLRKVPHRSFQGATAEEDLETAKTQQAVEAKAPILGSLITAVDAMIATTITPHEFRGREVAGHRSSLPWMVAERNR